MKKIFVTKQGFHHDCMTSAKFIGITNERKKIVIENCHLIAPPIGLGLPTPCLFGNMVIRDDIYYYK